MSKRTIRSFVLRGGRITPAQKRAFERLWPIYGIGFEPVVIDLDAAFGRRAPSIGISKPLSRYVRVIGPGPKVGLGSCRALRTVI